MVAAAASVVKLNVPPVAVSPAELLSRLPLLAAAVLESVSEPVPNRVMPVVAPSAPSTPESVSVPADTVVAPVNVLGPDSVSVPEPVFDRPSVPEAPPLAIAPASVVLPEPAIVSVRLVVSAAARAMPLTTVSRLDELLVQVWLPPSRTPTWPPAAG